jgi:phosphatidate cytidylyltransferase
MQKTNSAPEPLVRTIGTATYGAVLIGIILAGGIPFLIGGLLLTGGAAFEFYRLMRRRDRRPAVVLGIAISLLFVVAAHFGSAGPGGAEFGSNLLLPGLLVALVLSAAWFIGQRVAMSASTRRPVRDDFIDLALTWAGALYTGGLLSHAVLLRNFDDGAKWLLIVGLGAAFCDIMAYFVGSALGKHPFMPSISPRKTWEGTGAGFVTAVLIVSVLGVLWARVPAPLAIGWGLLLATVQIAGDLFESKLKRIAGVKDSGGLVPKQGGVLDVIDGFIFSVVVSYYFLILFVMPS